MLTKTHLKSENAGTDAAIEPGPSEQSETPAEAAEPRPQIGLHEKPLAIPSQTPLPASPVHLVFLGLAYQLDEDAAPFCAVTWSSFGNSPTGAQILLKRGWKRMLQPEVYDYIVELLQEWVQWSQRSPEKLLSIIKELSVGPVRTLDEISGTEETINSAIVVTLGDVERFSRLTLVK